MKFNNKNIIKKYKENENEALVYVFGFLENEIKNYVSLLNGGNISCSLNKTLLHSFHTIWEFDEEKKNNVLKASEKKIYELCSFYGLPKPSYVGYTYYPNKINFIVDFDFVDLMEGNKNEI